MRRSDVMDRIRRNSGKLKQWRVKSVSLFGSLARDQATDQSDVDLLVEFESPPTFDAYMDTKFFLEDLLGCRVDLVTPRSLRPRLRSLVEREAVRVA